MNRYDMTINTKLHAAAIKISQKLICKTKNPIAIFLRKKKALEASQEPNRRSESKLNRSLSTFDKYKRQTFVLYYLFSKTQTNKSKYIL